VLSRTGLEIVDEVSRSQFLSGDGPARQAVTAAVVIPARLEARRFPRKVLARDTGKYLIQHVYEAVVGTSGVTRVIIATDSEEVGQAARSFGAEFCMTSADHVSGTDRVAEVARQLDEDVIVNVQGDEPLMSQDDVERLITALAPAADPTATMATPCPMATLARPRRDVEGYHDPNHVKVVVDVHGRALYFSRSPIPARAHGAAPEVEWLHHIGVYAFRREFLQIFTGLSETALEKQERLEQLRVLENGYNIQIVRTEKNYLGIDTPEEYREFVALRTRKDEDQ
jgi:3-deoxy-D-manno-octulosonate cytidylyltransferase